MAAVLSAHTQLHHQQLFVNVPFYLMHSFPVTLSLYFKLMKLIALPQDTPAITTAVIVMGPEQEAVHNERRWTILPQISPHQPFLSLFLSVSLYSKSLSPPLFFSMDSCRLQQSFKMSVHFYF